MNKVDIAIELFPRFEAYKYLPSALSTISAPRKILEIYLTFMC